MENIFLKDIVSKVSKSLKEEGVVPKRVELIPFVDHTLRKAFEVILDELAKGNKVYLVNFMNFEPKDRKARVTKNPQTGEPVTIGPYRSVLCRPTKAAKEKLQRGMLGRP